VEDGRVAVAEGKKALMFRLRNDLVRVDMTKKLIPVIWDSRNCNNQVMQIPSCRINIRKESFYPRTIRDWNALPDSAVLAPNFDAFKTRIQHQ
jgi:ABC-type sulfate transport system substrate-binding protein